MMKMASAAAMAESTHEAVESCIAHICAEGVSEPDYLMAQADARHDLHALAQALRNHWPNARLHLATSCHGSFTETALAMGPQPGLCLFAIADAEGDYGTAGGELGGDARAAAATLTRAALRDAGRFGESPTLVWMSSAPGEEEDLIAGIQDVVSDTTPIVGGSAADNEIAGQWRMSDGETVVSQGLVLSVLFPSGKVGAAFHSGYMPTMHSGRITGCDGRRLLELDHRPAAQVYAEWTEGAIAVPSTGSENVLMSTSLWPLGRTMSTLGGADVYILSHPETIRADGSMTLFTGVAEGEEMVLMRGTIDALVNRPVLVAQAAARVGEIAREDIAGMILVFCAGCMLTVQARMDQVRAALAEALPGVPIIAAFTFGEQGPAVANHNRHGNLMISSVVFSR
ncbi:hypothetical protein CKO25_11010 [Thiocapsa imhoffii]|uniref:Histidine kinase n=1 Tax=Thiocapsa imhoffii TaxID=382777 RepID=A0A9X0WI52_9GAMM|nr:FIST N-terminal domain-containing protein [Thiocapsa imhoffii]MBK1645166.1 hypothetical protein [Thiocapsa imhoffii]